MTIFHEEYVKSFLCHWNEYLIRFDNNFGADWSIEIEFTRSLLKKIQDLFFRRVFNGRKCHPPKNLFLGIISIFSVFPFSLNSIPIFEFLAMEQRIKICEKSRPILISLDNGSTQFSKSKVLSF